MRKKLKGPELKMPELKVPAFLADLFYDLRDRRLLPLVALVVVAIAAVPFLLGGEAEELPLSATGAGAAEALEAGGAKTSSLTVVEATPGLRDYHKRLRDRAATDPFVQKFTGPASGSSAGSESGGGTGSAGEAAGSGGAPVESEESTETAENVPEPGPGAGGSGGAAPGKIDPTSPGLHFFGLRPDVRFGVAGEGQLTSYQHISIGQVLPKRDPVVVFLGVSEDGKRAAFHVSDEVALVRGPGDCTGGNQNCDLLFLRAGQAVDLLTGAPNRDFRLAVDQIDFVEVDPPKAAHASTSQRRRDYGFSQNFIK
jgi:hypothetical protein